MTRFASVLAATLMVVLMSPSAHAANPPDEAPASLLTDTNASFCLQTRETASTISSAAQATAEPCVQPASVETWNAPELRDGIAKGYVQRKGCQRWWTCGPFHRERSRLA